MIPDRSSRIGVIVGLTAEARIARPLGGIVASGGGTVAGAEAAARRLVASGVTALLSFGLAGGLDPELRPGALILPRIVLTQGERFFPDEGLVRRIGGPTVDLVVEAEEVARTNVDKAELYEQTGAAAIDLESGAVARVAHLHRLPFAILRTVCDPAERTLPSAALAALDQAGTIRLLRVLAAVAATPSQIFGLLILTRDAAIARRALIRRVAELGDRLAGM